ncbi:DinB family protein [Chitinophaga arvensicola]|uniref:DinB superfamily protein n=1 Tax=Chitinophaga arvensicola TaxID=29529 RepID=A0A1I0QD08_9BACT|nr:DinB family protein [Chitinophaga arvensicola]SEW24831.1 DinB superfamily protein [Chitinophaga arvensicola]
MNTPDTLRQFNDTIDKWITHLDDYTLTMLCQQPHPGTWSLGQVYEHIIADTWYFIGEIKTALQSGNINREQQMHPDANTIFAQQRFPDARLPNPANDPDSPQPASKDQLKQQLLLIKEEINHLGSTADFTHAHGKTRHPGLGFFNAGEWLQFAEMHMRHHLRQKKRIDDALFTPPHQG